MRTNTISFAEKIVLNDMAYEIKKPAEKTIIAKIKHLVNSIALHFVSNTTIDKVASKYTAIQNANPKASLPSAQNILKLIRDGVTVAEVENYKKFMNPETSYEQYVDYRAGIAKATLAKLPKSFIDNNELTSVKFNTLTLQERINATNAERAQLANDYAKFKADVKKENEDLSLQEINDYDAQVKQENIDFKKGIPSHFDDFAAKVIVERTNELVNLSATAAARKEIDKGMGIYQGWNISNDQTNDEQIAIDEEFLTHLFDQAPAAAEPEDASEEVSSDDEVSDESSSDEVSSDDEVSDESSSDDGIQNDGVVNTLKQGVLNFFGFRSKE